MTSFTKEDYPKITELLTMTRTITLDCEQGKYTEDVFGDGVGYIYLNYGGDEDFYGNLESYYLAGAGQKALAKRFRTFVQDDGEIGLEMKFIPGPPFEAEEDGLESAHVKALWDNTRLHEIMTYEEYLADLEEEVDWVNSCLGMNGEMYAVLVEVTKPGRTPGLEELCDPLLEKPLWIQRKGSKYNVHVHYWQD